jgi:hypothetical protein
MNNLIEQNNYSMNCLNHIEAQIEKIRLSKQPVAEMIYEDISTSPGQHTENETLENLINTSSNQNLEKNLNSTLNQMSTSNERIVSLIKTILKYENSIDNRVSKYSLFNLNSI